MGWVLVLFRAVVMAPVDGRFFLLRVFAMIAAGDAGGRAGPRVGRVRRRRRSERSEDEERTCLERSCNRRHYDDTRQ
ncbi:hypothetical protein B0J12DRAFT_653610 [Macrophomina phaseolina]|uniref:Secreted protein n=1 Tax=Macrophomina phaseolina TaxID=35725 RepID=A0ABQ8GIQ8_9PEZI|nr:hypothetical protein B0J12DRAFT_653610 [Macrophomina phaseolina]